MDKEGSSRQLELRLRPVRPGGCADGGDRAAPPRPGVADQDFCAGQLLRRGPTSPRTPPRPSLPTPPHLRSLTRSRHAWALGSLSGRPGRGENNSVILGCWLLSSSVPPSAPDPGAHPSVTRIGRGGVPEAAGPGVVFREVFRLAPLFSPPAGSGEQAWKRPGLRPAVPGGDFLRATKGTRSGPGAGRRAAEGVGGPPPWAGNGFPLGRPRRGPPASRPSTHRAGSGSPGPSPCPTDGAAGGWRRGTLVRSDSAGGLGSERRDRKSVV